MKNSKQKTSDIKNTKTRDNIPFHLTWYSSSVQKDTVCDRHLFHCTKTSVHALAHLVMDSMIEKCCCSMNTRKAFTW